jgi:cytochrome c oxidase assembly factor CtaG
MPSPLTSWTWDPAQLLLIAAAAFLYYRRAHTLAARGTPVPAWRRLVFALGLLLAFLAVASPIHELGEKQFFFVHMLQHILLGDLAPLCMVAGLTGPLLRPVLAIPLFQRLRFLAHPFAAFPIWAANLVLWHLPFAYQGALHHDAEFRVLFKVASSTYDEAERAIRALHSYDLPAIHAIPVERAHAPYADWVIANSSAQADP